MVSPYILWLMTNLHLNPNFVSRVEEWKLRGRPTQNPMDWNLDKWVEEFPEYKDFLDELYINRLGHLDREYLHQVVYQENENGTPIKGFLAVMIWGYGPDPRGPFRTRRIINQDEILMALSAVLSSIKKEQYADAFNSLVTHGPKHLGAAFATKYMYFASPEISEFQPVILDSLVSEALKLWGDYKVNSQTKNADDYIEYLNYMKENSEQLDLTMSQLELILFTEYARLKGNQSWANRQAVSELNQQQAFTWGILFASELMLRIPCLKLSYTEPGGGQYRCLSLKSSDKSKPIEIDINLVGSIHFRTSKNFRIEWTDVIGKGPTAAAESICRYLDVETEADIENASRQAIALRAVVSSLIDNFEIAKMEVLPVMVDNSVYGESINSDLLKPYELIGIQADLLEKKEIARYFWAIIFNGEPSRLVNLDSGESIRSDGTVLTLSWP